MPIPPDSSPVWNKSSLIRMRQREDILIKRIIRVLFIAFAAFSIILHAATWVCIAIQPLQVASIDALPRPAPLSIFQQESPEFLSYKGTICEVHRDLWRFAPYYENRDFFNILRIDTSQEPFNSIN